MTKRGDQEATTKPITLPLLIDVAETARLLSLSERTIYNAIAPKSKRPFPLRPRRLGRKVLFRREEVEALAAAS